MPDLRRTPGKHALEPPNRLPRDWQAMKNHYHQIVICVIMFFMSRISRFTLPFVSTLLIFGNAFPWEEMRHPIQEVLVQRLLLDENYVICGTDASWGTNVFGLFVFDRKTETWTNYPYVKRFPSPSSAAKSISKKGRYVDIQFGGELIRFDLNTGKIQIGEKNNLEWGRPTLTLKVDNRTFMFRSDSIIVADGIEERAYSPRTSRPHHPVRGEPLRYYGFCSPIVYGDKIFFGYNSDGPGDRTLGLGSFGLDDTTFHFYPSDIFKGRATSSFIHNSSIIFATADFHYEGNAGPAAGLVQFTPSDSTFKIWSELPLPDYPIAIFCLEQDTLEYWMGTDRGVFRIDKRTNRYIHYGITKGVIPRDGVNVYGCYGEIGERNQYPVVAELNKDETVDLLEIYHGWCEIRAPVEIRGYVSSSDVSEVHGEKRSQTVKVEPGAVVRVNSNPDANALVRFDKWGNSPEDEYQVIGWAGRAGSIEWYTVRIPTAWVYLNDLAFSMGEIK